MAEFRNAEGKSHYEASKKRKLIIDGVEYVRVKREKPKSRAQRCSDIISSLQDKLSNYEELITEAEAMQTEEGGPIKIDQAVKDFQRNVSESSLSVSDEESLVEELKDELESWYDNLPEQFQSGDKGDQLQSAISELDSAISELQNVEEITIDLPEDDKGEVDIDDILNTLNTSKDAIENAYSSLENVEFPGMFG